MAHTTTKCIPLATWPAYNWPEKAKNLSLKTRYRTVLNTKTRIPTLVLYNKTKSANNTPLCTFKCTDGFKKYAGELTHLTSVEAEIMRNGDNMFLLLHLAPKTALA